jgi:hypothetical protein
MIPELNKIQQGLTAAEKQMLSVVTECRDKLKFGKMFFPHKCYHGFAPYHSEIHEYVEKYRLTAFAAPRYHAKTTSITVIGTLHDIAYRKANFIVIVYDTFDQAALSMESISHEIENNIKYKLAFGIDSIKMGGRGDRMVINGKSDFPIMVRSMGTGQKFRGLLFRQWRPQRIYCDDIENEEDCDNPNTLAKNKRWFFGALLPALDADGKLTVLGTIIHDNSLLSNLMDDEAFFSKLYAVMERKDGRFVPLWLDKWIRKDSDKSKSYEDQCAIAAREILKLKQEYDRRGQLTTFYQEYFNIAVAPGEKRLEAAWYKKFKMEEITEGGRLRNWPRFITVDLAHEEEATRSETCYHALVVSAFDPDNENRYILDYEEFKGDFDLLVETFFAKVEQWNIPEVGIETVGAQKHFAQHIRNQRNRRGLNFRIVTLTHTKSKYYRIMIMQNPMKMGKYHILPWMSELEAQTEAFPRGHRVDLLDATASLEELIAKYINPMACPQEKEYFNKSLDRIRGLDDKGRHEEELTGGRKRRHDQTGY